MHPDRRDARVTELVAGYLRGETALRDYLLTVDEPLRDEVEAQCIEADFIGSFFRDLPPAASPPERPASIGGCTLTRLLGEGAMGEVYLARQDELARAVAVKLVRGDLLHRDDFLERFRREARTLAALDHPGIVKVLSFGEQQGWHYFVMELVRGQDLSTALPSMRAGCGGDDAARGFDRIARVFAELLEAVAYAHSRGVAHRDVKPSNVMLDDGDRPRLVDFGLAKAAVEDDEHKLRTTRGVLLGTPAYLCPEAARHERPPANVGDLWAVGAMLYQSLTGRLPYDADSTDAMLDMLREPRRLDPRTTDSSVPAALAAICSRALAPRADDRYLSAREFATDLRRFLARERVAAERTWSLEQLQRHARRNGRRYAFGAAALLLGLLTWSFAKDAAAAEKTREAVRAVADGVDVEAQPLPELAVRAGQVRELLANAELDAAQRRRLRSLLTAIEARARRTLASGIEQIHAGAGSVSPPRAPDAVTMLQGMHSAARAAAALPESVEAVTLLENSFATVAVQDPAGMANCQVRVQPIDPLTGRPLDTIQQATTPTSWSLPPGDYRITIGDEHGFAECLRTLGAPIETLLAPVVIPTPAATVGMILVPAGDALVGQELPGAFNAIQQTVSHPAFYIDEHEVTCAQYRAFCDATGHPRPKRWGDTFDPAWEQLPVVGVCWQDANAYAEWIGKRLPTWIEWQIAARGPSGFLYPWGDDAQPLEQLATIATQADAWFAGVRAVGTTPLDTSWCGVRDMLGNIDEWTSTPYVSQLAGMPYPVLPWRLRGGAAWDVDRDFSQLDSVSPGQPEWYGSGFRCAKSIAP